MNADDADAGRCVMAGLLAADLRPRLTAAVAAGRGVRQERSRMSLAALLASPASDRPRAGLRPARPRSQICVIGVHLRPSITPHSADTVHYLIPTNPFTEA